MNIALTAAFYTACPGIVLTREIDDALSAAYQAGGYRPMTDAAIRAIVLPLAGGALPPQPTVLLPIDGDLAHGTVATFAKGLKRFADSNPCPRDGWSIERNQPGGPV